MDTALPQKFPFILDRNLAKANCTGNQVCTSCDIVVLGLHAFCYSKVYTILQRTPKAIRVNDMKSFPRLTPHDSDKCK